VTQNIPNLHPTRTFADASSEKPSRPWLFLGALGIVASLGYAAVALTGSEGAPTPSPDTSNAALAALSTDDSKGKPATEGDLDEPAAQAPARALEPGAAAEPLEEVVEVENEDAALDRAAAEASAGQAAPSDDGAFYVRVASYKGEQDAAAYAASLTSRGLTATASVDPDATSWNVVRLGPFQTRGEAEKARFQLKVHEREKAYVMPRSNGKYHVQAGSFATLEEAEPVAKALAARGHVTKISRIKMGAQRWHCVRIGPFDTEQEATDYLGLVDLPGSKPVVIPYGPPKL
jgi:cell division protein FtsN